MATKTNKKKDQDPQDQDIDLQRSESLLREADEELRRERLEGLWKKYGGMLITACIMVVLGTAIGVYWKHHVTQKNMAQTVEIYDFLAVEDKAARLDEKTQDLTPPKTSQEWLILYYAANDALEQERFEDALAIYEVLRDERSLGRDMRWLADLMELRVLMQTQDGNDAEQVAENMSEIRTRLEELAKAEDNPWRGIAYMEAAVVAGQRQGEYNEALALLMEAARYSEGSTPLLSIIRDLTHLYTVQAQIADAQEPVEETPAGDENPDDIAPAANGEEPAAE